jgi:hypothetical protein
VGPLQRRIVNTYNASGFTLMEWAVVVGVGTWLTLKIIDAIMPFLQ